MWPWKGRWVAGCTGMESKRVTLCFGKSKPKWLAMPWKKAIGSSNLRFPASLGKDLLSDALEKVMAWNGKKAALCFGKSFACVLHTHRVWERLVILEKASLWPWKRLRLGMAHLWTVALEKALPVSWKRQTHTQFGKGL